MHAGEPGDLDRDDALVDADDAVFEGLGDALDAADVAAVEIVREAEFGVVDHLVGVRRRSCRRGRRTTSRGPLGTVW